jgi:outer membrane protein assembly factor BamA
VSYPISFFRRVELETSFGIGTKQGLFRSPFGTGSTFDTLRTAQLTNTLTLVHDNTLFAGAVYGPSEGWRANVSAGYTTDVANSNESYYTLGADVRHYQQLAPGVTFASWGLVRTNVGRRARLNLLGGAWSLRGFPFLRVRGQSLWFTSQELRFPIANRPPLVFPVLSGLRGALFADVAHNWSGGYSDRFEDPDYPGLSIGSTKGSIGAGARVALLGAIVLRYDIGWRFRDGLQWGEREPFSQIFFGWDF